LIVYVLYARDAQHYALGQGDRGKTDRVDTEMIRRLITTDHAPTTLLSTGDRSATPTGLAATARACVALQ